MLKVLNVKLVRVERILWKITLGENPSSCKKNDIMAPDLGFEIFLSYLTKE